MCTVYLKEFPLTLTIFSRINSYMFLMSLSENTVRKTVSHKIQYRAEKTFKPVVNLIVKTNRMAFIMDSTAVETQ